MILDIVFGYSTKNNYFFSIASSCCSSSNDANIWHAHLGHIGEDRINRLVRDGFLGQHANVNILMCEHCLARNRTKKLISKTTKAKFLLQFVHFGTYGPLNVRQDSRIVLIFLN